MKRVQSNEREVKQKCIYRDGRFVCRRKAAFTFRLRMNQHVERQNRPGSPEAREPSPPSEVRVLKQEQRRCGAKSVNTFHPKTGAAQTARAQCKHEAVRVFISN